MTRPGLPLAGPEGNAAVSALTGTAAAPFPGPQRGANSESHSVPNTIHRPRWRLPVTAAFQPYIRGDPLGPPELKRILNGRPLRFRRPKGSFAEPPSCGSWRRVPRAKPQAGASGEVFTGREEDAPAHTHLITDFLISPPGNPPSFLKTPSEALFSPSRSRITLGSKAHPRSHGESPPALATVTHVRKRKLHLLSRNLSVVSSFEGA